MTNLSQSAEDYQLDILKELINIGIGRAAGVLNQMTSSHVSLTIPEIMTSRKVDPALFSWLNPQWRVTAIKLSFAGSFSGNAALIFSYQSAYRLVSLLLGEDAAMDMDSLRIGALQEVGNIVLNGVIGSFANILNEHMDYTPPDYFEEYLERFFLMESQETDMVLIIRARFTIMKQSIDGDIIIIFKIGDFDRLLTCIERLSKATE